MSLCKSLFKHAGKNVANACYTIKVSPSPSPLLPLQEVRGLDQLHKYLWVLLIGRMFEGMAASMIYTTDLHLFLNVINGGNP